MKKTKPQKTQPDSKLWLREVVYTYPDGKQVIRMTGVKSFEAEPGKSGIAVTTWTYKDKGKAKK